MSEVNREVIRQLVDSGEGQLEIANRIAMIAESQAEREELRGFVELLRTQRSEDLNILSGKSRLSEGYRPARNSGQAAEGAFVRASPAAKSGPRPGPSQATSLPKVEAARERLAAQGRRCGERSIATELGVSRGAVRYALGKDRH